MASDVNSGDSPSSDIPAVRAVDDAIHLPTHSGYWLGWLLFLAAYIGFYFLGDPYRRFALTGLEVLPFLILAVLAYLGDRRPELRVLTFLYWLVLVAVVAGAVMVFSIGAVLKPESLDRMLGVPSVPPTNDLPSQFLPGGLRQIGWMTVAMLIAGAVGIVLFLRPARRTAAGLLPVFADSFVHTVSLSTIVTLTLVMFIPLLVIGQPPLLEFINHLIQHQAELEAMNSELARSSFSASILEGMSREDQSFDYIAFLIWLVPSAILAVGFPFARTIRESLVRVGLVWPSAAQVIFALLAAVALVGVMLGVDAAITWVWQKMAWPTTDAKAFESLMKFAINPWGAVLIGVVAGLGEELFVRGVLQPRLGILLSNLFFTAMHALQYNWDALFSVFLIGLVLGVIRNKTNTTTSAIVHGAYDFMLLLLAWYAQS
jgi:membrane protease YdiL (CAAX protease family)